MVSLDEVEHFPENQKASVATLRWCSASARNTVRLPFGNAFAFAGIRRCFQHHAKGNKTKPRNIGDAYCYGVARKGPEKPRNTLHQNLQNLPCAKVFPGSKTLSLPPS